MDTAILKATATQKVASAATRSHVCTLFEGRYHLGVAALTNSLVANGFRGTIWAGYRGALPPWATGNRHVVNDAVTLEFIPQSPDIHFANYKPQFMLDLIRSGQVDTGYLWYLDPDIVVDAQWEFFVQWSKFGICLVEDINNVFAADHPIRLLWTQRGASLGLESTTSIDRYFNSGFIGIPCASTRTLDLWQTFIRAASDDGADLNGFMPGNRADPFYAIDQDAMNAALMYDGNPHTTMGPEAMGFMPGFSPMAHAVGRPKTWEACRTLQALKGYRPRKADKLFYRYCDGQIRLFGPFSKKLRKLDLLIASGIARFYGRS